MALFKKERAEDGKAHDTNEVQFGKIPNPVVHQFLNQLRKVVNEFIKEHGLPESMSIELSRDLQKSQEERDEIVKKNKNNERKNAGYDELILKNGQNPSRYYRQCLTLHELQKGICPYTGRNMEIEEIFRGTVNREHILPRGDTLLDGMNNLVLADANANAYKGKRSPHDAFSGGYDWMDTNGKTTHIDYSQILKRVEKYPEEKKWAFYEGAMERFKDEKNFLKRFDGDTKYLGKIALEYLQCLYTRTHNNVQSWQSYDKYTVVEIRGVAHPNSEIPQGVYRGRSNSRLDIYLDGSLELGWEVVTRLNEMKKVPEKWRSISGAKLLFSLRQSDEVEMFDEARQKRFIARLQKMSAGDVVFFPVEVASADDKHPKKIRIRSLRDWKDRDIIPIVRTPLGKEKFKGKLRNT